MRTVNSSGSRWNREVPPTPFPIVDRALAGHPGALVMVSKTDPDLKFMATLRASGDWLSAVAVAAAHKMSWYGVAFALRRLAERGLVEEDVICVAGKQRSQEMTRVYRARPLPGQNRRVTDNLPAWLAPQAVVMIGDSTMIEGEAGMRRWEQQDADRRKPHPMRRRSDVPEIERRTRTGRYPATLAWRCAAVLWTRMAVELAVVGTKKKPPRR